MGIRLRLKYKILLLVLSVTLLIYLVSIGYIVSSTRGKMLNSAYDKARLSVGMAAGQIEAQFDSYMSIVQTLARAFGECENMTPEQWTTLFLNMEKRVYGAYPEIFSLWDSYEYSGYVPGYSRTHGRLYRQIYSADDGSVRHDEQQLSLTSDPKTYAEFKSRNAPSIWEPYLDEVSLNASMRTLMTTIAAPLQRGGNFAGLVGCDIGLGDLQTLVEGLRPFEGSVAFLISDGGTIAAHPQDSMLTKPVEVLFPSYTDNDKVREAIKQASEHSFVYINGQGQEFYAHIYPIRIRHSYTNWAMGISVPLSVITAEADSSVRIAMLVGALAVLALTLFLLQISDRIARPIVAMTQSLLRLGRGEMDTHLKLSIETGDEIESMGRALNALIDGLEGKNALAKSIGEGDLSGDITLLSEYDTLGQSLLSMRNSLRVSRANEEERRQENEQKNWTNNGIAQFSDLLRRHAYSMEALCDAVLASLVRYIGAEQGMLYLLDDVLLTQTKQREYYIHNAFAWGRKRYQEARFPEGVGLVGACAMEKQQTLITDVPEDYCRIAAGVGDALPRSIVLQPLLHDKETIGVIEIATFKELERFELDFLRIVSDYIAASLFSVQVSTHTQMLLQQSREQAEELSATEEELRQNIEELQTTQEETQRQSLMLGNMVASLSSILYYVEFDRSGYVTSASQNYLTRLKLPRELMLNTHFSDNMTVHGWSKREYEQFWKTLIGGQAQQLDVTMTVDRQEISVREYYLPIRDRDGEVERVIRISLEL